jgi:hypothetical protein
MAGFDSTADTESDFARAVQELNKTIDRADRLLQ